MNDIDDIIAKQLRPHYVWLVIHSAAIVSCVCSGLLWFMRDNRILFTISTAVLFWTIVSTVTTFRDIKEIRVGWRKDLTEDVQKQVDKWQRGELPDWR